MFLIAGNLLMYALVALVFVTVSSVMPQILNVLLAKIPAITGFQTAMPYVGLAAWIAEKLRFADCLAALISYGSIVIPARCIPFIGRLFG